jgi:tight adherence protein B
MSGVAAGCLLLAAVAMVWPAPGRRSRRRRILASLSGRAARTPVSRPAARLPRRPRRGVPALAVAGAVLLAAVFAGPVAAVVAGAYGAVAATGLARRDRERDRRTRRATLLDLLGSATADLRAGLPADTALGGLPAAGAEPLVARVQAAARLAERTGAPLADVVERIEADARSADRARAGAAAQSAGARATAWLLAALPVAGLGLGYAIGADPLAVLLHTPIGAACAVGAVVLQLAGLAWTGRIARLAVGS